MFSGWPGCPDLAAGDGDEFGLAAAEGNTAFDGSWPIAAIGLDDAGFDVVGEMESEDFGGHAFAEVAIEDGEDDFDAAEEIAWHPIGAADEDFGLAGIFEIEDTAVFEEPVDDAADGDIFAEALDLGAQAADPADDEIDFDAGLGGAVEGIDEDGVDEGIHLGDDASGQTLFGVGAFAIDEGEHFAVEFEGGDQEAFGALELADSGQKIKEICGILAEVLAAGEIAQVGVNAGGGGVVIAGAKMDITADGIGFAPDDQAHFAVDLVADQPVNDVDTGFLEFSRPENIVGFVESGFEFDDGGDLFAVADRVHQGADDAGIAAGAIEGLFDGQDVGILGSLFEKIDHGTEILVGMMQEDIAVANGGKEIGLILESGGEGCDVRGIAQFR